MLPFTHEQFVQVFAQYNLNVWPGQLVAYLLGLGMLLAVLRPSPTCDRFIAGGLAAMWLWTGIAYHALHFSAINKAAFFFGALFSIQALLFIRAGWSGTLRFGSSSKAATLVGWCLLLYALVAYPLLGVWAGDRYPGMPMFGITPCPVTIFTFGLLLLATAPVSRRLLVFPVIWSLIGGSAAFLLQVPQDWLLLVSGLSVLLIVRNGGDRQLTAPAVP